MNLFYICNNYKFIKEKLMEIEKLVLTNLDKSDKPLKGKEIAELAGVEKKEVDKAIKKLKKDEKIFSPKNCFYAVKK